MNYINVISIISIILFLILFSGRTIQMVIIHKINPFVIGTTKAGFQKFIELLLVIGLILWIYQAFTITLNLKYQLFPAVIANPIIDNIIMHFLGIGLMLIGIVIFLLSLISFGKSWRIGVDKKSPGELITTGIFKYSRNPIFVFMDIYFIGFTLVYTNIFFIIFSIITVLSIHYQILQEEQFLQEQYGEKYKEYKKQVRRYI